jgi:hypothetical protein
MSFGERYCDQHTAFFQLAQALSQLACGGMLIEVISPLFQTFYFFRSRYAARRQHEIVVIYFLAAGAVQTAGRKIKTTDFFQLKINFRT